MKRKLQTFTRIGLVTAMAAVLLLPGCGKEEAADNGNNKTGEILNETGMPIVKEPITLNFFAGRHPDSNPDWNDVLIFNEYEKMTNMDIQWTMVPTDILDEKRNLVLASGDYPDAFHTARIPTSDLLKYGKEGVFIPLNDLIDKYAPNLKKLFEQYPYIKKGITMPDGNIYGFPTLYSPDFDSVLAHKTWIRQDWLNELGLSMPDTTEQFYQMLKAMKEKIKNDGGPVIPFGAAKMTDVLWYFRGSWGLGTAGELHPYVDLDPQTNEPRFMPTDPRYKEMLEYLHKLYSEGLIDPNIFTMNSGEFVAQGKKGQYGVVVTILPQVSFDIQEYEILKPMKGPYGDQLHTMVRSPLNQIGSFVITSKNKYPEATVRWIDYFYGDEGIKLFFMGIEGVTYKKEADGTYVYTDELNEKKTSYFLTWPGGGYPSMVKQEYFKGAESLPISIESVKKIKPYFIKEAWPLFTYTDEENQIMRSVQTDIETYVNEMLAKFVTGKTPFTEWDNYVQTLKNMGLDKYMQVYKSAYQRYKNS